MKVWILESLIDNPGKDDPPYSSFEGAFISKSAAERYVELHIEEWENDSGWVDLRLYQVEVQE